MKKRKKCLAFIAFLTISFNQFPSSLFAPLPTNDDKTSDNGYHQIIHLNGTERRQVPIQPNPAQTMVIGIHTHHQNVSYCRWNHPESSPIMNGTNFGMAINPNAPNPKNICLYNPHQETLNVLLIQNLVNAIAPVPGGCNMEFPLEISPFIYVRQTEFMLINQLVFQRAAVGNETDWKKMCGTANRDRIVYHIHAYYGEPNDDSDETEYFHRLTSMSRMEWVIGHSRIAAKIDSQSYYFRLYFTSNAKRKIYFNIVAKDVWNQNASSLYVPSHGFTQITANQKNFLFIATLVYLAIISTLVSVAGHRFFTLEIFYFAFLLIFGLSIAMLMGKIRELHNLNYVWIFCIVFSTIMSIVWTLICRWSQNLRLALSLHSIVLSFWISAFLFDVYLLLVPWHRIEELFLNLTLGAEILSLHILLFYFLDLFWLSALSTSIITVYLQMLPFDIFFFGNLSLFRIIYNIWLHNTHLIDYPLVNLITLTKNDLLTFILFIFLISLSISWQLWSKIGNLAYGFGACINSGLSHQKSPTKLASLPSSRSSSPIGPKYSAKRIRNRKRKSRNRNKKKTQSTKRYRCKYCNKIYTEDQRKKIDRNHFSPKPSRNISI